MAFEGRRGGGSCTETLPSTAGHSGSARTARSATGSRGGWECDLGGGGGGGSSAKENLTPLAGSAPLQPGCSTLGLPGRLDVILGGSGSGALAQSAAALAFPLGGPAAACCAACGLSQCNGMGGQAGAGSTGLLRGAGGLAAPEDAC